MLWWILRYICEVYSLRGSFLYSSSEREGMKENLLEVAKMLDIDIALSVVWCLNTLTVWVSS